MSITSDLRSYADNAVNQGKQALDAGLANLANLSDIADKAAGTAQDLRSSAEKAVNLDALTSAVEPYLAQLKEYGSIVTDKVEVLVSGVRSDKRVAKIVDSAEPVVDAVVEAVVGVVQQHVVKPVRSLTGTSARKPAVTKPAASTSTGTGSSATTSRTATATRPARKAAATKPAAKPATKTARPASRPTARKAPAKSTPDA